MGMHDFYRYCFVPFIYRFARLYTHTQAVFGGKIEEGKNETIIIKGRAR